MEPVGGLTTVGAVAPSTEVNVVRALPRGASTFYYCDVLLFASFWRGSVEVRSMPGNAIERSKEAYFASFVCVTSAFLLNFCFAFFLFRFPLVVSAHDGPLSSDIYLCHVKNRNKGAGLCPISQHSTRTLNSLF